MSSSPPQPNALATTGPDDGVSVEEGTKRGTVTSRIPTKAQTALARRLAEVRATVPAWSASRDVDVAELVALLPGAGPGAPEPIDAIIRACGLALRAGERVSGAWRDGRLEHWSRANVALLLDDGEALATPVVHDADGQDLATIAARRRDLQARATARELRAPDSGGATFALLDAGSEGPDRLDVIMPPGIGAALAVGRIARRPWIVGDAVQARHVVTLTLSADHRAVLPAHAAAFLAHLAASLEQPAVLLG
ncbi:2-oxo acid dehydrogenase subunit E2 [Patulibacter brassicae]|uniref:2-oxo acid dehydrogenase subunit E2 n=1 Tax=Patulibacter brassicae TaxID=1705717 RepID=A0ABU4VN49_9ACTN|nr:2-oxo acid dehydrogenase subunit E2 [Patulibacter brassicae]MDX8152298.1 2-oxo acid dehydrogenase subunit E2 [Patulibacter brassicae]